MDMTSETFLTTSGSPDFPYKTLLLIPQEIIKKTAKVRKKIRLTLSTKFSHEYELWEG